MATQLAAALLGVPDAPPIAPHDVRRLRLALDLTQDEAAGLVGVALNTWSRWERGEVEPHRMLRAHLAGAFRQLRQLRILDDQAALAAGDREQEIAADELEPGEGRRRAWR